MIGIVNKVEAKERAIFVFGSLTNDRANRFASSFYDRKEAIQTMVVNWVAERRKLAFARNEAESAGYLFIRSSFRCSVWVFQTFTLASLSITAAARAAHSVESCAAQTECYCETARADRCARQECDKVRAARIRFKNRQRGSDEIHFRTA